MTRLVAIVALSGALTTAACDGFGQAMTTHTDILARAAGHELTVDQAANLLAPATRIPAQNEVADAIANLWIDYTLLAVAAMEDSTLANVELDGVIEPFFNQQLVYQLRDSVVQVDTMVSEDELRRLFNEQQPGAEVKARHILFRVTPDASPEVRDSVMKRARAVLEQARGGADFAKLAQQYSEEPGADQSGGDLGYFGRDRMVPQFEEAAFALETGQISSDLVETPFGYHIIKVEDKRMPDYETAKAEFRSGLIQRRFGEAEEQYLKSLTESKKVEVQEGAADIAREIAQKPSVKLSRRAASRTLVRYEGGGLTAGEYLRMMHQRPAQQRGQIAAASDDQLTEWLRLVARDEILIEEAKERGITTPTVAQDSARDEIRNQLREAARSSGLMPIQPQEGESRNQAVQRQVLAFLNQIVNSQANVVPLGAIGFALRDQYGAEVFERAVPVVIARVTAMRPAAPQQQQPQLPLPDPQQVPPPPPPTTGGN